MHAIAQCGGCGGPLQGHETAIGVCVACVAVPPFPAVSLPRPRYGRAKESSDAANAPPKPD